MTEMLLGIGIACIIIGLVGFVWTATTPKESDDPYDF